KSTRFLPTEALDRRPQPRQPNFQDNPTPSRTQSTSIAKQSPFPLPLALHDPCYNSSSQTYLATNSGYSMTVVGVPGDVERSLGIASAEGPISPGSTISAGAVRRSSMISAVWR